MSRDRWPPRGWLDSSWSLFLSRRTLIRRRSRGVEPAVLPDRVGHCPYRRRPEAVRGIAQVREQLLQHAGASGLDTRLADVVSRQHEPRTALVRLLQQRPYLLEVL